ncbi:hypothetical protein LTR95_005207 [Oleoguttula sp. CCFEE 5521]
MRVLLTTLPPEVLELIAESLSLSDLNSLRLVNRDLAVTIAKGRYLNSFKSKRLLLTSDDLLRFQEGLRNRGPTCALEHLTLVSPLLAPDEEIPKDQIEQHAVALATAWQALSTHTPTWRLKHLTLEVDTCPSYEWITLMAPIRRSSYPVPDNYQSVLRSALFTFRVTVQALERCTLPLDSLDLFGTIPRCSLPMSELCWLWDRQTTAPWMAGLRNLTISMTPSRSSSARNNDTAWSTETPQQVTSAMGMLTDPQALVRFLKATPNLSGLSVRHYDAYGVQYMNPDAARSTSFAEHLYWCDAIAKDVSLLHLSTLTLRHTYATEAGLARLLSGSPLRSLTMEYVHLKEGGSFQNVLKLISGPRRTVQLQHLALADLWENRLMRFAIPWKREEGDQRLGDDKYGPLHVYVGKSDDLKELIKIARDTSQQSGEIEYVFWLQYCRLQFGPPS